MSVACIGCGNQLSADRVKLRRLTCNRSCQDLHTRNKFAKARDHKRKTCSHSGCSNETLNDKYCSRSCAASVNNTLVPKRKRVIRPVQSISCSDCSAVFSTRDPSRKFCNRKCYSASQWTPETLFVRDAKIPRSTVKRYLLHWKIMELKCLICGVTQWMGKPAPIDLDHINGDKHDHRLVNLRMLCAMCHRQTPTHGWKNVRLKKQSRIV